MSDSDRHIRPYHDADQPQIEWLYARTPPAGQIAMRPRATPIDLQEITTYYAHFLVVVEMQHGEEAIIGMAGVEIVGVNAAQPPVPDEIALPARTARLRHVAVAPERQRTGIGRLLVDTAGVWCREHAYEALMLETTPEQEAAVGLYLAMGFTEVARSKIGSYDLVWFERDLHAALP